MPSGDVQVRVCQDNICAIGWVSSMHLVQPKENQLREAITRRAAEAFAA